MLAACGNSNAAGQKVRAPLEGIAFGSLELEMSSTTPRGPMPHYDTMPPKKRQCCSRRWSFPGSFGNDSQATQKIRQLVEDHEDLFAVEKDQAEIP